MKREVEGKEEEDEKEGWSVEGGRGRARSG